MRRFRKTCFSVENLSFNLSQLFINWVSLSKVANFPESAFNLAYKTKMPLRQLIAVPIRSQTAIRGGRHQNEG